MVHPGIHLAIATWVMTGVSLTLVALRLFTRIHIVSFVGAEDHLYAWTGLLLLGYASCTQVAVSLGLGRDFWDLSLDESSRVIFWTYVANTFAIVGNAMAKLSMGMFLLRVVQLRWHRVALWALCVVTGCTSAALAVMLWNQTDPVRASWDPLRTPGKWNIQIQPMSVGLGAWSSACDFFFAIFPWLFTWSLRLPPREKVMLASGMSLGVIAGACGIVRTVVLARLDVNNYTLNFVTYFAWAGAEIAVAMMCLGIPTLRPLYLRAKGVPSMTIHIGYGNAQSQAGDLPMFTMCENKPSIRDSASSHTYVNSDAGGQTTAANSPGMISICPTCGPVIPVRPESVYKKHSRADSVDEILDFYEDMAGCQDSEMIWVKNDVVAELGKPLPPWPMGKY